MKSLLYVLMCIPAVLMPIIGYALSQAKKESTMKRHHFASNFNIRKYEKKVIKLFAVTGIAFSVGGIMIMGGNTEKGIAVLLISFVIFITAFIIIQKKH